MKRQQTALCTVLLLAPAANLQAEPLRLEALAGWCKPGIADWGTWHNEAYPTRIEAASGCVQIGASQVRESWHGWDLGWRASYLDFGQVAADNTYAMRDDQQSHIRLSGKPCNPDTHHGCVGRGFMRQETRGVTLGGLAEHAVSSWTLGLDAGGYLYYSRFRVITYPVAPSHFEPLGWDWSGWSFTPFLGVTANRGVFFAAARSYLTIRASESCTGCTGITSGLSYQLLVGLQVPLN